MKRSQKTLIAVLAGTLLLGSAGAALAFGGHPGNCRDDHASFGPNLNRGALHLDGITDDQRSKLDQLRTEQRDVMRKQMTAMRDSRTELREAMDKGTDIAAIRKLAEKNAALTTEMIVAQAEARQKVDAILTPAQRQQLQQRSQRQAKECNRDDERPRHGW